MRIVGTSTPLIADKRTAAAGSEGGDTSPTRNDESAGGAVVVHIGTRAVSNAGASPARLEALRASIEAGSYDIDFGRLAERMIDEELARAEA